MDVKVVLPWLLHLSYGPVSTVQQTVHECSCPAHSPPTHYTLMGTVMASFQEAQNCPWLDFIQSHRVYKSYFVPRLILTLRLASLKSRRKGISPLGFSDNLVKHSVYWACVITLRVLVKMKFAASHVWLFRGALSLRKPGLGGRGVSVN